jgi:hypothetical protein
LWTEVFNVSDRLCRASARRPDTLRTITEWSYVHPSKSVPNFIVFPGE